MARCMHASFVEKVEQPTKVSRKWHPYKRRQKNNFYAVKSPEPRRIYTSWNECKQCVHGESRAVYKGFVTRKEAEAWLAQGTSSTTANQADQLRIYVDGSYMPSVSDHAGWAYIVIKDDKEFAGANGATDEPALSRNIDGEIEAVLEATKWFNQYRQKGGAVIVHDYEGIAQWALGNWKAESEIAKRYVSVLYPGRASYLGLSFESVKGHSGDQWNDRVDSLAKEGLLRYVDIKDL